MNELVNLILVVRGVSWGRGEVVSLVVVVPVRVGVHGEEGEVNMSNYDGFYPTTLSMSRVATFGFNIK